MKLRYLLLGLIVPAMMICCEKPVDQPIDNDETEIISIAFNGSGFVDTRLWRQQFG